MTDLLWVVSAGVVRRQAECQVLQVALGELLQCVRRDEHLSPTIHSPMVRIDNAIPVSRTAPHNTQGRARAASCLVWWEAGMAYHIQSLELTRREEEYYYDVIS